MKHSNIAMPASAVLLCISVAVARIGTAQPADTLWADNLNTAKNATYMTDLEKEVVYEMNKVRTNPKLYAEYLRHERTFYTNDGSRVRKPGKIDMISTEGFAAIDECIAALEEAQPAGILYPEEVLCKSARLLAKDQAKTGGIGHIGKNGSTMKQRVAKYGNDNRYLAENCAYGSNEARDIVIQLLIDEGVPSRGHRNNIMNARYVHCGVAADKHPKYRHLCVIDYAD
jgi:uncharacterized protein YkwD